MFLFDSFLVYVNLLLLVAVTFYLLKLIQYLSDGTFPFTAQVLSYGLLMFTAGFSSLVMIRSLLEI